MVYVNDDILALYLSLDTLSDLGVLSKNFLLIGKHQKSLGLNGTTPESELPACLIRSIRGGCIIPGSQDAFFQLLKAIRGLFTSAKAPLSLQTLEQRLTVEQIRSINV